jgi:hypothetical protein
MENTGLVRKLDSQTKQANAKFDDYNQTIANDQQSISLLQSNLAANLTKSKSDLADFQARLDAATKTISDFQVNESNRHDEQAKYDALVSAPALLYEAGRQVYFFSKIIGVHGGTLATNGTFGGLYGSHVAFRFENGSPKTFNVDDLHPKILQYLGIDAEAAKLNQRNMDAAYAKNQATYFANLTEQQRLDAINREAAAKIADEQAKADEELREKQEAAENERIKALAAEQSAQAQMIQAEKPPSQINVIQQQVQ